MQRRQFLGVSASLAMAVAGSSKAAPSAGAAAFAARRRMASTPFGQIAYVGAGRGPLALFLHAWPLNGYEWRGALGPLSAQRRCVAPDAMGLGYSEPVAGRDLSPASQADMLAALMQTLGADQADFVANDSGGLIAQVFAARHPERVRSLLLTNCDVAPDNPPPSFVPLVEAAKAGLLAQNFAKMAADPELARSPRGLGTAYARPEALSADTLAYYLSPLVASDRRKEELHRYTVSLGHDDLSALQPRLAQLRAPVRIVWGQADTLFDPRSPDRLDRLFPQSRGVRRVPGAKLFFPEEEPQVVVEEARGLWASVHA